MNNGVYILKHVKRMEETGGSYSQPCQSWRMKTLLSIWLNWLFLSLEYNKFIYGREIWTDLIS